MQSVEYPTDEGCWSDDNRSESFVRSPYSESPSRKSSRVQTSLHAASLHLEPFPQEEASCTNDETEDFHDPTNLEEQRAKSVERKQREPGCCQSCCLSPRTKAMYTTADWWSLWIGLISFATAFLLVYVVPFESGSLRVKFVVPTPMPWKMNPLEAWDLYNATGTAILLFVFLWSLYFISLRCMGKLKTPATKWKYLAGFTTIAFLAILAVWMGENEWCKQNGIGYAVFAILIGMVIGNTVAPEWLLLTAKDGEFFIKCSLVLLAVQYNVLASVGIPAMAIAWIGSPLAVILSFVTIRAVIGMDARLAILVSMGAAWCGASAISAVAPVVSAKSEDVSLTISVVAFFTVAFTFIQPYAAIGFGLDDSVAGAWVGASVDQTGNVIASGTIISEEALEVASIVKMVLNAGLGFMATFISCWWSYYVPRYLNESNEEPKRVSILDLWDKFPKFVLGFLITSGILTLYMNAFGDTVEASAIPAAIKSFNRWWFALAFCGIGITTNITSLYRSATESGIIWAYLIANAIDIGLALGLAIAIF